MGLYGTYYSDMFDKPTCLYRIYDAVTDDLLYVGISKNPIGRMSKHQRRAWWPEFPTVDIVWFDDREQAKSAERHAIRDEYPIHNMSRPRVECC